LESIDLAKVTIRILDADGVTKGAGFLIAPGLAVTCAHVIDAALSRRGYKIFIAALSGGVKMPALVLEQGWSSQEVDDLAFLRLETQVDGLEPVVLSSAGGRMGHTFAALGFPRGEAVTEKWAQGMLADVVGGTALGRAPVLQFQGQEIQHGFSGAALLDAKANQVIGMVCEYTDSDNNRQAFGVTAETIQAHVKLIPDSIIPGIVLASPILSDLPNELLSRLIEGQRDPGAVIQVGGNLSGGITFLVAGSHHVICLSPEDLDRFNALKVGAESRRLEEIYLARFILNLTYARWDREYVPLAGSLTAATAPVMRLHHSTDPVIGQAGLALQDIREAIMQHAKSRLVILGDPGAGKSTTLDRLALDLARRRLNDPVHEKIPVRVDLFEFNDPNADPDAFLKNKWETYCDIGINYAQAIGSGRICFLLDGLNQMPFEDRRDRFYHWANWILNLPPGNWAVFTCRSDDFLPVLNLPEVHVQSLDRGRIHQYLEIYFGPELAKEKWVEFEACLQTADDRFDKMVSNPLMLSLLVQRSASGKSLTDNRAELMRDLAERRLLHELDFGRQPDRLRVDDKVTVGKTTRTLERLAYAMQKSRGEGTSFKVEDAREALEDVEPDWPDLLKLSGDAGLIQPRFLLDEVNLNYAFAHHLFQEYFAAGELICRHKAGDDLRECWQVPWQFPFQLRSPRKRLDPPAVTGWEETTLMAAARKESSPIRSLVKSVARVNLPLAGRVLAAARRPDFEFESSELRQMTEELRQKLLAGQRSPWVHLRGRIAAGLALGELGHPDLLPKPFEFEGKTVWLIPPKLEPVPSGPFLLGSSPNDRQAYSDEKIGERKTLLPSFAIGRYPVTNAEYRFFIASGGYNQRHWWSEAGWAWRQGGPDAHRDAMHDWLEEIKRLQNRDLVKLSEEQKWNASTLNFWQGMVKADEAAVRIQAAKVFDRAFDRPAYWDDPALSAPARPVVGVNWHEAAAYCAWLSAVTTQVYRLPRETEWEKAVRGMDGADYPWGWRFDPRRCNTVESWIGQTTPVGLYANGRSTYNLWDTSGNVWEWTSSWYQAYPGMDVKSNADFGERFRVLRGGSWDSSLRNARCACRLRRTPGNFDYNIVFRVFCPGAS